MTIKIRGSFLLAVLLIAAAAQAQVGSTVGRITGVVREATSKDPIAGATVTVTGPVLIGPPRTTLTDNDGRYSIVNLPPGDYDVTASVTGANPITRRVLVRANEATPVEFAWSPEMTAEAVTIVAEELHPTRPDTSMTGATFTMEKQNNLPVFRQYQSIVAFAPGVNTAASLGNPSIKGANDRNNRILIDGLDTSDPLTNTFSANINQDSLAAVQVLTGGFEAKYNALGGIQNLITNSGSDDLHFDLSLYTQQKSLQDFYVSGPNLYNGPRPFSGVDAPPIARYSTALNVNGPILKHKLWFSAGLEWDSTAAVTPAGPPLNKQAPNRVFADLYPRLKLTWAPTDADKVMIEGLGDPTTIDYVNNTGAAANTTDPFASLSQLQGGWKTIGEWDHFFTPDIDGKVLAGYSYSYIENGPQGYVRGGLSGYSFAAAGHLNNDDGTRWFNSQSWQRSGRHRVQFDGSLTGRGHKFGSHETEVGWQSAILAYKQQTLFSGSGDFYSDTGGGPLQGGLCDADPALTPAGGPTGNGCSTKQTGNDALQRTTGWTLGFYAQDRWKPTRWLTLLPGLRYDMSRAHVVDGGDSASIRGFGPRFSAIFDLTNDEKTILQLSYGHATEMTYLSPFNQIDGARKSAVVTSTWNPATKTFVPVAAGAQTIVLANSNAHVPPHSDELTGSIRRELFTNSVGSIDYTYKRTSNVVEFVEQNLIYDPSGNRAIGGLDGTTHSILVLSYPDANKVYYSGFDFVFEARPTPAIDVLSSYTLAWTWGPGYQNANDGATITNPAGRTDQFSNPRQAKFVGGYVPFLDVRHQIKTQFTYTWRGATFGTTVTWRSGIAYQRIYTSPATGTVPPRFRAPNGIDPATPNDATSWADLRTPDLLLVNLAGTYDFYEQFRQHIIAQVTIFNLFDASTATGITASETAPPTRFGQVSTRTAPLSVQLGIRYQY